MRGTTATMAGGGSSSGRHPQLPYRIPGPAGFGFSQAVTSVALDATPSQVAAGAHRDSAVRARPFETVAWHALLRSCNLRPYGPEVLTSSVALVKSEALRQVSVKSRLAVRVEKLSYVGKDASVSLADPTGSIAGTVHAEVFADRNCGVEEGAVLLLKNVAAQYYRERRQAGFHADENDALHLSVQSVNIERVFGENDDRPDLPRKEGVLPYVENALRPPKVSRQTIRRQRAPGTPARPMHRTPGRPQSGNVGRPQSSNVGRPYSATHGRPQMSPPGSNYGSGPQGRPQSNMPYRAPPVHRPGLHAPGFHAPRAPLQRGNFNISAQQQPQRDLNKRPGARPFQSPRPVQRPRYQASGVNESRTPGAFGPAEPAVPVPTSAADTLTDDQLDSLLGNVDIEAAIAAATQSSSPQGKENSSQPANTSEPASAPPISITETVPSVVPCVPIPKAPLTKSRTALTAQSSLSTPAAVPSVSVAENPSAQTPATCSATPNVSDEISGASTQPAPQSAPATDSRGIGGIDDSMLDSLLDGLDSEDFS